MSEESVELNFYKTFLTEDLYLIPEKENEIVRQPVEETSTESSSTEADQEEKQATAQPKEFLIVHESNGKLVDEEYELLKNILNAVNISLKDDVDLLEMDLSQSIDYTIEHHNSTLIVFSETELYKNQPFYEPFMLNDRQVLLSKKLTTLISDRNEKAALWKALKKMFDV